MKNTNITDSAINNINRKLIYKFTLDGKELPLSDVMNNPTITYDCGLDQYSVGNLYIGELTFSVKNTTFVNYKSEIVVTVDIQTDSGTISTKLGKFYVDTVVEQGVTKQIKAYDGMFLLNVGYFPSARHTTTKAIVDDIASKHNLTILGFENRTANINNEQIDGKTVLEMLQLVAGVHGCSIFMNGDGAVKFVQATDTGKTYTKSQYSTPTLDTSVSYNITKLKVIYGEKTTNEDGSVKDEGYFEVGEGLDSRTLAISNVLLKGQRTQAQNILNVIKNMNGYNRFDTTILLGDYRLEPMDVISYVKDDKTYKVPIIYMQIALTYSGLSVRTQSPTLAESKSEFSFKGTITQKIDNVYTEMMQVKDIVANSITVGDLEAINAEIENLQAKDATITNLVASKANITDLNAVNAEIDNLQADYAEIGTLVANKADIASLHATNAEINSLKANVGDINYLMSGHITSGNIQAGGITSDRLNIDNGFIKDAMIDTVSASKILAGKISTGSVLIGSDDGKLVIADETIQISDGKQVRVQIGETANGDYAIVIYDEDGNVMFDATGITENAIKDAIIKDDMVADDANINGKKIDITSLVTAINEDGSSTINVSKLYYDSKGQSFEVVFNEMTTKQNELEDETDALMTELNVQKGQISTLVQNSTITHSDGTTTTLKDAFSEFQQTQDEINLRVEQNISNIEASDVGATNLLRYTDFNDIDSYPNTYWSHFGIAEDSGTFKRSIHQVTDCLPTTIGGIKIYNYISGTGSYITHGGIGQSIALKGGETYTMSVYVKVDSSSKSDVSVVLFLNNSQRQTTIINTFDKWHHITYTFTCSNSDSTYTVGFGVGSLKTHTAYICGMKLEKGSMATDWSPSPYDLGNNLASLEQRVNNAELKITDDAITSTVTSSTTYKQNMSNISSSIITTSKDVKNYSDRGRNLVKQSKTLSALTEVDDISQNADTTGGWRAEGYDNDNGFKRLFCHMTWTNYEASKDDFEFPEGALIPTYIPQIKYENLQYGDGAYCYIVGIPLYPKSGKLNDDYYTVSFECSVDSRNYFMDYLYFSVGKYKIGEKSTPLNCQDTVIDIIPVDRYEDGVEIVDSESEWGRYAKIKCTLQVDLDDVTSSGYEYRLVFYATNPTWIRKPKIEVGTEATKWTQAPEEIDNDLTNLNQEMQEMGGEILVHTEAISSLQVNADSINASVQEVNTTINAITGELNTLTNKVEATMSSEDIKFLVSSEVANSSVGKVTTETGFTFDKDGLTISKSDSEMSTLVDEDGMTIYKNNDVMLDVNNQGVDAQNVNVKTYLIIGTNSRMENYLNNRTAIFFIGDTEV